MEASPRKRIMIVFGTRPEAIKMAPLAQAFRQQQDAFETKVCVTAQHRKMLDQVLEFFEIQPDFDLDIMRPNQDLFQITSNVILGMRDVFLQWKPDYVFVHGDTTTSTAAALAAFYANIQICHVEAGLRTHNKWAPFPEEINRQLTGRLTDWHFTPTTTSRDNLLREGVDPDKIILTGNTVIDALLGSVQKVTAPDYSHDEIEMLKSAIIPGKELILVTGHRRENFGDGFIQICEALREIADTHEHVQIIYPVHLNPNVQKPVYDILDGHPRISLVSPLSYPSFIWLMDRSKLIITDSGGVQEEAPSLGKPVLVMRDTTERPEAVAAGTVILVGTDKAKIVGEATSLLLDTERYNTMSRLHNPYGDGKASLRIVDCFKKEHPASALFI